MIWIGIGSVFVLFIAAATIVTLIVIRVKRDTYIFYENSKRKQEEIERKFEMMKEWKQTIQDLIGVRIEWESRIENQMGVRFEWEASVDKTLGIKSDWERKKDLFRKLFDRYKDE